LARTQRFGTLPTIMLNARPPLRPLTRTIRHIRERSTDELGPVGRSYLYTSNTEEIPMNIKVDPLTAARAEALFASHLSAASRPTYGIVDDAIRAAMRTHGGVRGCAAHVAAEYGDHPEVAVPRMRWARGVIDDLYASRRSGWALVA
jgi:hypothetical protein